LKTTNKNEKGVTRHASHPHDQRLRRLQHIAVVGVLSWGWEGEDGGGNHGRVGGGEMEADGIKKININNENG